jgi:chromosome segregation ATPase
MMRASKEPMTVAQLERSMDRQFKSVGATIARSDQRNRRQFAKIDRRFTRIDRRFTRIDRRFTKIDRRFTKIDQRFTKIDQEFAKIDQEFRRQSEEMRRHFEETRRHFDIIAESLRDDLRIFADGIAGQSERLDKHEVRITQLERRPQ